MKHLFTAVVLFSAFAQAEKITSKTEVIRVMKCQGQVVLPDGSSKAVRINVRDIKETTTLPSGDIVSYTSTLTAPQVLQKNSKRLIGEAMVEGDPQDNRDIVGDGWDGAAFYELTKSRNGERVGVLALESGHDQRDQAVREYDLGLRYFGKDMNGKDDIDLAGKVSCKVK